MPINSRQKGKVGEREFADELKEHGFDARRGQQYSGLGGDDVVVAGRPDWHLEIKRVQRLNVPQAMAQALADAGERTAILAHRQNRSPWLITMTLPAWLALVAKADRAGERDQILTAIQTTTNEGE